MRLLQNKVIKNAGWLIGGKIAQSVLTFIIGTLTARYLGPSNYGIINYASSIVAFVVPIMNLGFGNVLVQEFTNHPEEEGKIVGTSIILSLCSSIACIIGVVTYTLLVDAGETITNIVVLLYSIMLIAQAFELIEYWYQYKLLSKYTSIFSLIAYAAVSAYKFILLATGQNVCWFAISYTLDYALIAAALLYLYKKLGGQRLAFNRNTAKRMFASSKYYIVSSLMVTIFAQTDKVMIKLMMGEAYVGYYSAALTCSGLTGFVFSAIIDTFRPVIFQAKKENKNDSYDRNLIRLNSLVIYLSLAQCIALTLFSSLIVSILYGAQYEPSVLALRIIVWYSTFSYLGATRDIWILAEGKQKYLWILNLGGALMNVFLNYRLIPIWGIYGAAFASLVTQIFTNIVMNVIVWPLRHNNYYIYKALNPKVLTGLLRKGKNNEGNN